MTRRGFDEIDVTDRALLLFWRLGYDGCSITDLVSATGLGRQSLYSAFGDKQGLFIAVLKRYEDLSHRELASIRAEESGLAELRRFMERVLAGHAERDTGACLMVKTAFGPAINDRRIKKAVERTAGAVRTCFEDVLRRAKDSGELAADTDLRACAAYLYSVLNGLSAFARTGGTTKQISAVLSYTFEGLARA